MKNASWRFVLALFATSTLLEISAWGHGQAFGPLFIKTELGVPEEELARWAGILAGAPLLVAVPLSPFWGVLADQYSAKLIILRSLVLEVVGYGLAVFTENVWQFFAVRLILGLTFGSNAVIVATLSSLVPERRIGLAIGVIQMMLPIGSSLGPLMGSGLIALFGLRGMFAADALLCLAALVLVARLYKEPKRPPMPGMSILTRLKRVSGLVWHVPPIRASFVLFFMSAAGNSLITPFLPVLIDSVYEGENLPLVIGVVLGGYGLLAGVSAPLWGRLADRMGPLRIVLFSMIGLGLMSAGLVFASTPLQVGLVVLLGAIPFGAASTTIYAYLARHTPREHMAGVMSLTPLSRNSAMLVAPFFGAAISGFGLPAIFAAAVGLYVVATGMTVRLVRAAARPKPGA